MRSYGKVKTDQNITGGAADTGWGAAGEEDIYEIPSLHSWFSADPIYFDGTTGTYRDKGPRGNNWKQPTSAQRPTPVADWLGTGYPSLSFDGVNDRIPADFNAPVGSLTIVAVCDAVHSLTTQSIVGSNIGAADTNQKHYIGLYNGSFFAFAVTNSADLAPTGLAAPKSVVVANFDPLDQHVDIQVNGGSWATRDLSSSANITDCTLQIGAYRLPNELLMTGNVAEVLIFSQALKGMDELTNTVATLKSKYGIA